MSLHDDVVKILEGTGGNDENYPSAADTIIHTVRAAHRAEIAHERRLERDAAYERGRRDS